MAALDDIKDRFKSEFKQLTERIQESGPYIKLSEQYENLTPVKQKLVILGGFFLLILFLVSIPWGYYSASKDYIADFEDKRQLIRDLLKVSRDSKEVPSIPIPPDITTLRAQIQGLIESDRLLPEQIKGIENTLTSSRLIPGSLSQGTVSVTLDRLNLRQVIDIGYQLQSISPSVKMTDLNMTASSQDPRLFQVLYKLVVLAVPTPSESPAEPEPPARKRKSTGDD
jgi:hypothetical protein